MSSQRVSDVSWYQDVNDTNTASLYLAKSRNLNLKQRDALLYNIKNMLSYVFHGT
jgi:hypothetical protein